MVTLIIRLPDDKHEPAEGVGEGGRGREEGVSPDF